MQDPHARRLTMRHALHYGDRVVRCFAGRPPNVDAMFKESVARFPERDALVLQTSV